MILFRGRWADDHEDVGRVAGGGGDAGHGVGVERAERGGEEGRGRLESGSAAAGGGSG